ncbi:MAG: ketopantoate reductase family protein [Alkalispirochaeta sp.]
MKQVVVFGMGGIGGYIGAHLGRALSQDIRESNSAHAAAVGEPELTFVARGDHLGVIKERGLTFTGSSGETFTVRPARATAIVKEVGTADVVFLCVKGYGLTDACRQLRPVVGKDTAIIPLLNGADVHERIRQEISEGVVLPGAIYISSAISEPGHVVHAGGPGNIVLGREPGDLHYDPKGLLGLLKRAEIPTEWFDDPLPAIWTKYLFIASFGLTTAMSGKAIDEVIADRELATLTREIQNEIAAIAKAKGIKLPADAADAAFEKGTAFPPGTTTSFQRDVARTGAPNEGDLFGGTILRLGKELNVPTPTAEKVYRAITEKR